jgi:hypothetical protein
MATDMLARELEQMTPAYYSNYNATWRNGYEVPNLFVQVTNFYVMALPGSNLARTNIMQDVFFLFRQNQTWTGLGYFVRTNRVDYPSLPGGIGPVGALFRFEANDTLAEFEDNPGGLFASFIDVLRQVITNNVSKVMDGVTDFRVRPFDPVGSVIPYNPAWYAQPSPALPGCVTMGNLIATTNLAFNSGEIELYKFYSNTIPASLELEIGILEQHTYEQYQSIPVDYVRWNFLTNAQARAISHMHLFRQSVPLRNVDRAAYQPK